MTEQSSNDPDEAEGQIDSQSDQSADESAGAETPKSPSSNMDVDSPIARTVLWARNNPTPSVFFGILILSLLGTSVGLALALDGKQAAIADAEKSTQVAELTEAREETTRDVLDELMKMFEVNGPEEVNAELSVADYLENGEARIAQLQDEPELQSELMEKIGRLRVAIGDFDAAQPLLERVVDYREANPGRDEMKLASALHSLAELYIWLGRNEDVKSLEIRAIEIWEKDPLRKLELAQSLHTLATAFQSDGDLNAAFELNSEALGLLRDVEPNGARSARIIHDLGLILFLDNDLESAERSYEKAIEIESRSLSPNSLRLANTKHVLSIVNTYQGKFESALRYQKESLAVRQRVLPETHELIASSKVTLGNILRERGEWWESEQLIREAIEIHEQMFDSDHNELWWDRQNLVWVLMDQERWQDSEVALHGLIQLVEGSGSEYDIADMSLMKADLLARSGHLELALEAGTEALGLFEALDVGDDPLMIAVLMRLAQIEASQANGIRAKEYYERGMEMIQRVNATNDISTLDRQLEYASALLMNGSEEEARQLLNDIRNRILAIAEPEDADLYFVYRASSFLLDCPDDSVRDPNLAFELATRLINAIEDPPPIYLSTLAKAQYLKGELDAAWKTQQAACDKLPRYSTRRRSFLEDLLTYQSAANSSPAKPNE